LIIFVLMTTVVFAQQTMQCTQIGVNNLAGQNPYITGSCLEVNSNLHVNNKNVIMEADNRIHLGPGTRVSLVQQGNFHASIRPNALQVAWIEPGTVGSVGKYEKLEIGIKIPEAIQSQIFEFLNSGTSAVDQNHPGLNPFNPEEVSVEAIFSTTIGNIVFQLPFQRKAYGFWYREFDRSEFSEVYSEQATDYHFRIRFAPPNTGVWRCVIKMYINGVLTNETLPFQFNVVNSSNHGYVKVGDSKRFLTLGNNMFFPIGTNIPQASCHGSNECDMSFLDPTNHQDSTNLDQYWESYLQLNDLSPIIYDFYKENLRALHQAGGNTFRYLLSPWGNDIEYESINNYDNHLFFNYNKGEYERSYFHSQFAWEFDKIIQVAEAEDVYMLLNVQWHAVFNDCTDGLDCSFTLYDWVPNNSDANVNDQGYCYNRELGLLLPKDYLTDAEAKLNFKYKLRYIASRWGYSTAILAVQLLSEINGAFEADMNTLGSINSQIESWHSEMLSYLKDELQIPQLTSVSYAGEPARPIAEKPYTTAYDKSFYLQNLDLPTYNEYYDLPTRAKGIFNIRKNWFPANNTEFYSNYLSGWSFDYYKRNKMKPMLNSEIGSKGPDRFSLVCDNKVEWIRNTYITPFTGMAGMSLHWNAGYDYALWQSHFPQIAAFLAPYNFNESSGNVKGWMPGHDYVLKNKLYWVGWPKFYESHPKFYGVVDLFYLRSPDNENAVGIVANRTCNFYTNWACSDDPFGGDLKVKKTFRCLDDNEEDGNNVEDDKQWVLLNDDLYSYNKTVSYDDEKLYVKGLSGNSGLLGKRYTVEFISPWTLTVVSTATDRKGVNGVQIKYPDIRGEKETFMYLIRVYPYKDKSAAFNPLDTSTIMEMYNVMMHDSQNNKKFVLDSGIRIYPNPANDWLNIEISTLSGMVEISIYDFTGRMLRKTESLDELTKIDISNLNPSTFIIKIATENNLKTIKFVKQ